LEIDRLDRDILRLVQTDATLSHGDIADRVGTSPTSCWRRLKRLEEAGVLRGRVSLLDGAKVGLDVHVICMVSLKAHHDAAREGFERYVAGRPEVLECYAMTGDRDYMLHIVVSDVAAAEAFLLRNLLHHEGVASASSSFALKQVKYTTALPV
jgi:Lrp/AsnC family transcriptional regulator